MSRLKFVFAFLVLAHLLGGGLARAATLSPTGDTFNYQFLPSFNFNAPVPGFGSILSAGATGIGHDTDTLIQFDVSSLAPLSASAHVLLELFVDDTSVAGFGQSPDAAHPIQVDIYAADNAWTDSLSNWGNQPGSLGAPVVSNTIGGIGQYVPFDVTSLVQSWIASPATNHGLLLRQASVVPGTGGNLVVGVFDSSAAANGPLLTTVPEPSSVVLAITAMAGLVLVGKRRHGRVAQKR